VLTVERFFAPEECEEMVALAQESGALAGRVSYAVASVQDPLRAVIVLVSPCCLV